MYLTRNLFDEEGSKLHPNYINRPKFGKCSFENDISVEDQEIQSPYVLSPKQEDFIRTKNSNDRTRLDRVILQKRDKLPERVHNLVRDIVLLDESPYFEEPLEKGQVSSKNTAPGFPDLIEEVDFEHLCNLGVTKEAHKLTSEGADPEELARLVEKASTKTEFQRLVDENELVPEPHSSEYHLKEELWTDLIDITDYSNNGSKHPLYLHTEMANNEIHLGYELGNAIRQLQPNSNDIRSSLNLIWGFALAFLGDVYSEHQKEKHAIERFIYHIREQQDRRYSMAENWSKIEHRPFTPHEKKMREGIKEENIEPHPIVYKEVKSHCPKLPKDLENQKKAAKKTIERINNKTPLGIVNQLRIFIDDDRNTVEKRSVPGIDSDKEIFKGLFEETLRANKKKKIRMAVQNEETADGSAMEDVLDGVESEEISPEIFDFANFFPIDPIEISGDHLSNKGLSTKKSVNVKTITESLNRYANIDQEESITEYSLVQKSQSERGNEWELTKYGMLLCYTIFTIEESGWMYRYALGTEELSLSERKLITDALAEARSQTSN